MDVTVDDYNAIHVKWGAKAATITMCIHGKPDTWIEYDLMQLEGLISLLEEARDAIVKSNGE